MQIRERGGYAAIVARNEYESEFFRLKPRWGVRTATVVIAALGHATAGVGAQENVAALADALLVDGLRGARMTNALYPCTDENSVVGELLSRELDDVQTERLASALSNPWQICPDDRVDTWLVEQLTERISGRDWPQGSCSVDCRGYLSGTERSLWTALENRRPPNATELWLRVAETTPSNLVRGPAWVAASQSLSESDRVAFFLEHYQRPDLPGAYAVGHAYSLGGPVVRHLDAGGLAVLADVDPVRNLLYGMAMLATRAWTASPTLADSAFAVLNEALALSEPGPRRDELLELVENARIERRLPGMSTDERIEFYLEWLRNDPPPLRYQDTEPHRLLELDSSELLARLSPDLFIDGADDSGDARLIFALGNVAGWPPGTSVEDSVRAMALLEEALMLGRAGPRGAQIEIVITNARTRRVEHGFPYGGPN